MEGNTSGSAGTEDGTDCSTGIVGRISSTGGSEFGGSVSGKSEGADGVGCSICKVGRVGSL